MVVRAMASALICALALTGCSSHHASSSAAPTTAASSPSRIAAAVGAVEVTETNPNASSVPPGTPTTYVEFGCHEPVCTGRITDRAVVARLVAIIDGLSQPGNGYIGCTADSGQSLRLVFYSGGPPLSAVATSYEDLACHVVSLRVDGSAPLGLRDDQGLWLLALNSVWPPH